MPHLKRNAAKEPFHVYKLRQKLAPLVFYAQADVGTLLVEDFAYYFLVRVQSMYRYPFSWTGDSSSQRRGLHSADDDELGPWRYLLNDLARLGRCCATCLDPAAEDDV